MKELQKQIVELLTNSDSDHLTCDDIAWKLKRHKIHIGNSVKSLVKKGIIEGYVPLSVSGGSMRYYINEELPKSIDIDKELELLRAFQKKKDSFKLKGTGDVPKDVYDKIQTKEYQKILDKEMKIEDRIKKKLWDVLMKYCDKKDFDGAKWFVGNSYKEINTCGKVLLFRSILIRQDQNK